MNRRVTNLICLAGSLFCTAGLKSYDVQASNSFGHEYAAKTYQSRSYHRYDYAPGNYGANLNLESSSPALGYRFTAPASAKAYEYSFNRTAGNQYAGYTQRTNYANYQERNFRAADYGGYSQRVNYANYRQRTFGASVYGGYSQRLNYANYRQRDFRAGVYGGYSQRVSYANYQQRSFGAGDYHSYVQRTKYDYVGGFEPRFAASVTPAGQYAKENKSSYFAAYNNADRNPNGSGWAAANENRVRAETITQISWQWGHNPVSVLNAMKVWPQDWTVALSKLKEGQAHNKGAQRLYEVAAETLPDFWTLVFYGTPSSEADYSNLEQGLAWQSKNDYNSLNESYKAWNATPRQEVQAYYYLLWAQRSNPKALETYRACWSSNRDRVMSMVGKMVSK